MTVSAKGKQSVTLYLAPDIVEAVEDLRHEVRAASRTAVIESLLREALEARKREKEEVDEDWLALERVGPKQGDV